MKLLVISFIYDFSLLPLVIHHFSIIQHTFVSIFVKIPIYDSYFIKM